MARSCSGPLINQKATHLDLLEVLPKLHIELLERTSTIGYPAFPSLEDSWIDPLSKELPYGKEIGVAIAVAVNCCNKDVLENYLKEPCREMIICLTLLHHNYISRNYIARTSTLKEV